MSDIGLDGRALSDRAQAAFKLNQEQQARIADHTFHQEARVAWTQMNLRWETENAFINHQMLYEARPSGRVKCMSEAPGGGPAIIIGSGSTLDKVIDRLKDWKGAIICSTTHGSTLVHHGVPPTYMCCLDPRQAPDPELEAPPGGWDRTNYIAHVSTPRQYFIRWFEQTKSTAYVFRIMEPTVPWYTRHLPWAYPWVKVQLLPFIDSVASEVGLAARLGYDPIYCIGVDYGGPRFQQAIWKDGKWEVSKTSGVIDTTVMNLTGEKKSELMGPGGITTTEGFLYAKRGMLLAAFMKINDAHRPVRIYQMSKPTNVLEFPYVSFDEVMESQGQAAPPWDKAAVNDAIETTLAKSDTFLIPINSGFGVDYRVYMLSPTTVLQALSDLNMEILMNKNDLLNKERDTKASIPQLVEGGALHIESGELVIHERADLQYFHAADMAGVDIEKVAARINRLYDASRESTPPSPTPLAYQRETAYVAPLYKLKPTPGSEEPKA